MVAKITVSSSIRRTLNYNENKMKEGVAFCIHANHFIKDAGQLNFSEKLNLFVGLINLNKRASTNAVHISLNFASHEKLEKEKLVAIANDYMEKIGFAQQPYLVYQHHDAGHPHIHIVSTNIKEDGKRMSLHNIGRNQSAKARKEIETAYGLIKAEEQNKKEQKLVQALPAQRIT